MENKKLKLGLGILSLILVVIGMFIFVRMEMTGSSIEDKEVEQVGLMLLEKKEKGITEDNYIQKAEEHIKVHNTKIDSITELGLKFSAVVFFVISALVILFMIFDLLMKSTNGVKYILPTIILLIILVLGFIFGFSKESSEVSNYQLYETSDSKGELLLASLKSANFWMFSSIALLFIGCAILVFDMIKSAFK